MDSSHDRLAARVLVMARSVRERRKALRLTQVALSHLAGCGPDFVYDVEAGKPTLRLDKLLELLSVLGLELVLAEGKEGLRVSAAVTPPERPVRPPRRRTEPGGPSKPRRPSPAAKKRSR
ncbi:MAG TPA: type II toxin-antitoxin system Y4mF family antitoxin [Labilithrix sp.]|nr:type II toxin-antitoxin system Y4mF family antitoxin [Labilithrix sp.]